jgi:hypothetical protein
VLLSANIPGPPESGPKLAGGAGPGIMKAEKKPPTLEILSLPLAHQMTSLICVDFDIERQKKDIDVASHLSFLHELGATSTVLPPSSAVLLKPLLRFLALSRLTILSSCLISCTLLLSLVEHRVVSHHDNTLYSLHPRLPPRLSNACFCLTSRGLLSWFMPLSRKSGYLDGSKQLGG